MADHHRGRSYSTTLAIAESVLRAAGEPLTARQIVDRAGDDLPTRATSPSSVVHRDLAMDIKRRGDASPFCRVAPGFFTLRAPEIAS